MQVDVELLRRLKKLAEEAQALYLTTLSKRYPFCDECGNTDPLNGFYPLDISGPNNLSGFVCNDCRNR